MYTATIKDKTYQIHLKEGVVINDNPKEVSFEKIGARSFRLTMNGKEFIGDMVAYDTLKKTMTLRIGAKKIEVQVKEPVDLFLDQIGIQLPTPKTQNQLLAPMPGLILKILVEEGQAIRKGDPLLILEAMKMENVFKAHADGQVMTIHVQEKQAVEKGAELIRFE